MFPEKALHLFPKSPASFRKERARARKKGIKKSRPAQSLRRAAKLLKIESYGKKIELVMEK